MKKILLFFAAAICAAASWAADVVTATVNGQELTVGLTNETNYVAFQMDIALPEGVTVASENAIALNFTRLDKNSTIAIAGSANSDFVVAYNVIEATNTLRIVAYNLQNREIKAQEGDLFTVTFAGGSNPTFDLSNILFVTKADLKEIALQNAQSEAGGPNYDINKDGYINALDAITLIQCYLGGDEANHPDYDVTGDGRVNSLDAIAVIQYYLSM